MYKIRGKVLSKKTEEIKTKKGDIFKKMLVTLEETDTGFHNVHQFELFGETSIDLIGDKIKEDRIVKIDFYIKTNEWKDRYFNTLSIKDVDLEEEIYSVDDMPFTD
tara:strand:- start:403 stop:720 length:318 start_codon:yes stop_codon:yes gene_type:complete